MKVSIAQTFLLIALAILGLAVGETQKLRGANVEQIANEIELTNERNIARRELPTGPGTDVDVDLDVFVDSLDFDFSFLDGLIAFILEIGSGGFGFNFDFFF